MIKILLVVQSATIHQLVLHATMIIILMFLHVLNVPLLKLIVLNVIIVLNAFNVKLGIMLMQMVIV